MNTSTYDLIAQLCDPELSLRAAKKLPPSTYRSDLMESIIQDCVKRGLLDTARAAASATSRKLYDSELEGILDVCLKQGRLDTARAAAELLVA